MIIPHAPTVRDLTLFSTSPMPSGLGRGGKQCLVNDLMGKPRYTAYYDAACAMAEVTYSRLCNAIGLACVQADYAIGLQPFSDLMVTTDYVSVSEYHEEWLTLEAALQLSESFTNVNLEKWKEHCGLNALLFQPCWHTQGAGYIRQDGTFVKANNGASLFTFELRKLLESKEKFYPSALEPISVAEFLQLSARLPQMIDVLEPMSALTDAQIEQCAAAPEGWHEGKIGTSFFTLRLKMARDCAKRILKAYKDDVERLFVGL